MSKTMSKVAVGALALVVAFGVLCAAPSAAHAASTTSVYVITKQIQKTEPSTMYYDGEEVTSTSKSTTTYKYDKSGLIKKYNTKTVFTPGNTYNTGITFKFDKKNHFVSGKYKNYDGSTGTQYYSLDKKGRVKDVNGSVKYKYFSNSRVKKVGESGWTNTFTWNSNGLLTKVAHKEQDFKITFTFTYDAKKQLATMNEGGTVTYRFDNTYKSGRLSKRVKTQLEGAEDGSDAVKDTVTYTYKKIKVPKKMAAQVKAQQKWIYLESATWYYPPLESMCK